MAQLGRVRSVDPESAELADVALAALGILEFIWREDERYPTIARFWHRVRMAIAVAPVAPDLLTCIDAAHGLRDLAERFPVTLAELPEVAVTVEERAWRRERVRLGVEPRVAADAG